MSEISRRDIMGAAAITTLVAATAQAKDAEIKRETIAVIGTGNVGSAMGKRWGALGHKVIYGSRSPEAEKTKLLVKDSGIGATAVPQKDAAKNASIVLLAAPPQAGLDVISTMGDLSGKILIDAMNEMSFQDGKLIEPTNPEALAARIQAVAPGAFVVKALNATTWRAMAEPTVTGGPITVPMAGASADAKTRVAALLRPLGLDVFDMGGAEALKLVEHLGRIYVAYSSTHRPQRMEFSFRTWTPPPGR